MGGFSEKLGVAAFILDLLKNMATALQQFIASTPSESKTENPK